MMIRARSSFSRMARQTWRPLIFGRSRSQTMASGRFANARSIPALPSSASITSQPWRLKRRATRLRLSTSSSMSSTVGMVVRAGLCQSLPGKQAFSGNDFEQGGSAAPRAIVDKTWLRRWYKHRATERSIHLQQTGTEAAGLAFFPAQVRMKIDFFWRHIEADRAEQIGNALAAFHRFLQAAREELDVFLVGFEGELAFGKMLRQRFIVVIDELDERAPQLQPHLRIDDHLERRGARIRLGDFLSQRRLVRGDELVIARFVHLWREVFPPNSASGRGITLGLTCRICQTRIAAMKTSLITLLMGFGLATVGFGAGADAELKTIEQQWLDAYMKSDASFITKLEAEDYSIIEPDGAVSTKDQDVKSVTDKTFVLKSGTMSDFKCRMVGENVAVVTAMLKMR